MAIRRWVTGVVLGGALLSLPLSGCAWLFPAAGDRQEMAQADTDDVTLVAELRGLGFDKYRPQAREILGYMLEWTPEDELSELLMDAEGATYPYYTGSGRVHDADAENLAEGGVGELLAQLRVFLQLQGVPNFVVEDYLTEARYEVVIDGTRHEIWQAKDLEDPSVNAWELAAARTFALVNQMLERAGSQERAYGFDNGAYGGLIFLTRDQFELLARAPGLSPQEVSPDGRRLVAR